MKPAKHRIGATMNEYALLAGLIATVIIVSLITVGVNVVCVFDYAAARIATADLSSQTIQNSCGSSTAFHDFHKQLVNAQFNPAAPYTGAAILGSDGDIWNQVPNSFTTYELQTSTGADSGVSVTVSMSGGYISNNRTIPNGDTSPFAGTQYQDLLDGFFLTIDSGSITLSGLKPNGSYQLVIYTSSGGNGNGAIYGRDDGTQPRSAQFSVGDVSSSTTQSPSSVLTEGVSYTSMNVQSDADGNMVIQEISLGGDSNEVDVNAIQLQGPNN